MERLPLWRYLGRIAAGVAWFALMGVYVAVLVWVVLQVLLAPTVVTGAWGVLLVSIVGLPIRRQWVQDREEVLGFFRRAAG